MKIKEHRQKKHNVTCVHVRTAEFYDGLSRKEEEKTACANGKERERERKERRFVRFVLRICNRESREKKKKARIASGRCLSVNI